MPDSLSSDLASLRIQREVNPENRGSRLRWVLVLALLVGLAGAAFLASLYIGPRVFKTDVDVTEIRTISPAQASIQVTSTGYVVAQRESTVGARVAGRVAEVLVHEGSVVAMGDVLVRLDDAEQRTAIAGARARTHAARARLASAQATHAEAARQFEREQELSKQGASARSVAEDLEARVRGLDAAANAAQSDVDAAEAELDQLQVNLSYLSITAPINGTVVAKPVSPGELVGPTSATPVARMADFSTLMVETDVPEARLGLIRIGGPAEIVLDAYPTVRHRGRVVDTSPRVNRVKATVIVRVAFVDPIGAQAEPPVEGAPPAEGAPVDAAAPVEGAVDAAAPGATEPVARILPDMAARVSFLAAELDAEAAKEPPKLFVPASAITTHGGEKVVFRADDGHARREVVALGPPMTGGYELLQGPPEGTRVIANPPVNLDDGYPIREKNE